MDTNIVSSYNDMKDGYVSEIVCPEKGRREMAESTRFTEEQIEILRQNAYIQSVSSKMVRYTPEFKEAFWKMYVEENLHSREILRRLGIDPNILGQGRIRSLAKNIAGAIEQYEGIEGFRANKHKRRNKRQVLPATEMEIGRLRSEIEYLRQECEFLKKIISAGKEASLK